MICFVLIREVLFPFFTILVIGGGCATRGCFRMHEESIFTKFHAMLFMLICCEFIIYQSLNMFTHKRSRCDWKYFKTFIVYFLIHTCTYCLFYRMLFCMLSMFILDKSLNRHTITIYVVSG